MFKILIFTLAVLAAGALLGWIYPYVAVRTSTILALNAPNEYALPRNFRITPLGASASSQFSKDGLRKILDILDKKQVVIVDLREESHGYLNGNAISWLSHHNWSNHGKSRAVIIQEEQNKLQNLSGKRVAVVFQHKKYPVPYLVKSAVTEEELAHSMNAHYFRLPITDHVKPSNKTVDDFVKFVKQLPKNTWIHFHCSAGKGRASTMLTMLDMMQRGNELTFAEFISRQVEFGGINLLSLPEGKDWKHSYLQARAKFLEQFQLYCKDQAPNFAISWSNWNKD